MKILSLLGIFLSISILSLAQRGKNGNFSSTALNTIVNSYTAMTANATAGQTTVTVASNALTNSVLTANLSPGDLLLIIQMQGASMDIDVTATVSWGGEYTSATGQAGNWFNHLDTWGQVTNYNQAGKYEYAQVASVSGANSITLSCGLKNSYAISGKVQVIRVPRFNNLTVASGTSIVPTAWAGTTGGVVVMEIDGNLTINAGGKIEANGKGFRGGRQIDNVSTSATSGGVNDVGYPGTNNASLASEKGEGIGGFTTEYDALYSKYGLSSPANGGGGGGYHNCGGGGGSNVGSTANPYTGKGIPNPAYNTMWALENPSISGVNSSGGGRGGYSYSTSDQNESTMGPNNLAWSGDYRRNNGGRGGHPLNLDATRAFMGGGGGAGDRDNNPSLDQDGAGGAGGGIVMLQVFGNISGAAAATSLIEANGADGIAVNSANASSTGTAKRGNDGAGGGGGGGCIIISNKNSIPAAVGINSNGGKGGNQNLTFGNFATNEADGPGGGGAAGQVSITAGTPTVSIAGGTNGVTTSTHVSNFPPNGATSGSSGMYESGVNFYDLVVEDKSSCGNTSETLTVTVEGTLPAGSTVYWYTNPFGGTSFATGLTYTTPVLTTTTTYYVGVCPGDFRKPVTVTIGSNPVIAGTPVISDVTCTGNDGSITGLTVSGGTPSYNYSWSGTVTTTADLTGAIAGTYTLTVTDATGCTASSGPHQINSTSNPVIDATGIVITNTSCGASTGSITGLTVSGGTAAYTYSWNGNTTPGADLLNAASGNYTLTVTDASGCTATSGPHQVNTAGGPSIDATNVVVTNPTCAGNNGSITGITQTGGTIFSWSNGGGTSLDATNLPAGTYTLTVTDAGSCSVNAGPYTLTQPAPPTIDVSGIVIAPETCGNANGSITGITANGTGLTYAWSNSTSTNINLTNADAGTYTLTVTDANSCTASSGSHTIADNGAPALSIAAMTITPATCGLNNGEIEGISVSGGTAPVTFSWTNTAQTTLDISNLAAGNYTLTATDANGCTATSGPHAVTATPLPVINDANVSVVNESCVGNNGSITGITVSGTGLTYAWNGTTGTLNQNGLSAGTYNLVVTDANNCTASSGPYTVGGSVPLNINITNATVTASACDANTGTISGITLVGGTSPTFTWSNNATTLNQTGLAAGTYTIVASDNQGCTDTEIITVPGEVGPNISTANLVVSQATCGEANGSVQGLVAVSSGTITYSWTGTNQTTLNLTGLSAGSYSLTATNAAGCTSQYGPYAIGASANPTADFSYNPTDINPGDQVSFFDLSSNDVIGWNWLIAGQTFNTENPDMVFVEGSYPVTLIVTNAAGCTASITKVIEVFNEMTIPNVLTTNNDGVNDKFEIKGLESNTQLDILNRWGNLVFRTSNYLNDWTGLDMNGEKLSDGVYTYYIRTAKGESKQGFIHLID